MTVYQFDDLPENVLLQVNRLCNAYESACRTSSDVTPLLEDWLTELPDDYRMAGIWELLPVEVAYRRQRNESCDLADYRQRFPKLNPEQLAACLQTDTHVDDVIDLANRTTAEPTRLGSDNESTRVMPKTIGDYEIVDVLGKGGMGTVYRAIHRRMDRTVALKVLRPEISRDPSLRQRFEREVRAVARLSHPNIVAALDAREEDGVYCLITEFIEGDDLRTQVRNKGPLSPSAAIEVVLQVARGLEYAHSQGVIHRDIKPANLLRDTSGVVKILDMGLARIEHSVADHDSTELTASGMMMGTAEYMSPEQARNTKNADARSDLYSLGCTLYFLLTGRPVYRGESAIDTILAHGAQPIPSLPKHAKGDSLSILDGVFQRMVAKKPDDRFQSSSELIAALSSVQEKLLSQPADRSNRSRAPQPSQRPTLRTQTPTGVDSWKRYIIGLGVVGIFAVLLIFFSPSSTAVSSSYALRFDGQNSYASARTATFEMSGPITLEVVCRIDQLRLSNLVSCLGPEWMALFLRPDGCLGVAKQVGSDSQLIVTTEPVETGQWHHVAGVWDGQQLRLFVNGESVETEPMGYTMPDTQGGLYMGGVRLDLLPPQENDRFFAGSLQAVRISRGEQYTKAFEPPTQLTNESTTLALYQFDEGTGTITHDASGNNHDATLHNTEWLQVVDP